MKKRLFALLLAFAMVFALPLSASADVSSVTSEEEDSTAAYVELFALEDGTFLVSDTWNKVIWHVTDGETEAGIFAGNIAPADLYGEPVGRYVDGAKDDAYFIEPRGSAPFGDGWAVADAGANVIRLVNADGTVRTLAGSGSEGSWDGIGTAARFDRPVGLVADDDGGVFIADSGNDSIRQLSKDGRVTTVVTGLHEPAGLFRKDGDLYVAESGGNRILKITNGAVEVLAGDLYESEEPGVFYGGYADGPASRAEFDHPEGIAVADDGTVYVADTLNRAIRALADGRVRTVVRSADMLSFPADPVGLAFVNGTLYATDAFSGTCAAVGQAELLTFADVADGDWFAPYVANAALRGIVEGDNGSFRPLDAVTAAEFVTMLSRVAKSDDGSTRIDGNVTLPEADEAAWYAKQAKWAIENGLGDIAGSDWNAPLTRYQLAMMLYLFTEAGGYDVSGRADINRFTDIDDLDDLGEGTMVANIRNAFQWAVAEGIFEGDDGKLMPLATASRAEAAKVAVALMDAYGL